MQNQHNRICWNIYKNSRRLKFYHKWNIFCNLANIHFGSLLLIKVLDKELYIKLTFQKVSEDVVRLDKFEEEVDVKDKDDWGFSSSALMSLSLFVFLYYFSWCVWLETAVSGAVCVGSLLGDSLLEIYIF